jgi:hypothetical protein
MTWQSAFTALEALLLFEGRRAADATSYRPCVEQQSVI